MKKLFKLFFFIEFFFGGESYELFVFSSFFIKKVIFIFVVVKLKEFEDWRWNNSIFVLYSLWDKKVSIFIEI